MIKLTLTPQTQPICYIFEKNRIAIGKASLHNFSISAFPANTHDIQGSSNDSSSNPSAEKNLITDTSCSTKSLPSETSKLDSTQPDLPLSFPTLLPEHVTIEEIDGQFLVINTAHDPFTTLNGLHFRKKFISNGDLLEIHSIAIQFEGTATPVVSKTQPQHSIPSIEDLLRRVEELEEALLEANGLPPKRREEFQLPSLPSSPTLELTPPPIDMRRKSLKDDYLRDLDDENEGDPSRNQNQSSTRFVISWTALFSFAFGLLIFCGAAFAIFYMSMIERSEKEEIKVAAAVADVVMALNFAQINHALPQNQNWSDPDFLKHNLTGVLANGYQPLANIDTHGQFQGTSYILRIYTSSDLAHFLVIAQPHASLIQTLVPKSAIIVDSQLMELRKNKDLKTLNRLLIDPTLDSSNSGEIAYLVGQGELITFDKLNRAHKDNSFSTPKALAFIRPGAENLIYNALRYYHFGESLTKKAVSLYETRDNQHDVSHMMQEIEALVKFKNIVLYTSGGLQTAITAQKALGVFAPQHKFLFGYLQLNRGLASSGHLLIDEGSSVIAALNPADLKLHEVQALSNLKKNTPLNDLLPEISDRHEKNLISIEDQMNQLFSSIGADDLSNPIEQYMKLLEAYDLVELKYQTQMRETLGLLSIATLNDSNSEMPKVEIVAELELQEEIEDDDEDSADLSQAIHTELKHPLYYKLAALYETRQQKLNLISGEIIKFEGSKASGPEYQQKCEALTNEYQLAEGQMQEMICNEVKSLHQSYANMPLTEFMSYLNAAGLEPLVKDNFQTTNSSPSAYSKELFNNQLETIQSATSFQALNAGVQQIANQLTLENVADTTLLIAYQNAVHTEVVLRLDQFLLSPNRILDSEELHEKNRPLVESTLQSAWVSDQDEIDYYMNEFDLLTQQDSKKS